MEKIIKKQSNIDIRDNIGNQLMYVWTDFETKKISIETKSNVSLTFDEFKKLFGEIINAN